MFLIFIGLSLICIVTPVRAAVSSVPETSKDKLVDPFSVLRTNADLLAGTNSTGKVQGGSAQHISLTDGTTIDVPTIAKEGVRLVNTDGSKVSISLPSATNNKNAQTIIPGMIGYVGNDGSSNVVQLVSDGSFRMLTVISSNSAPTAYDYNVDIVGGGSIILDSNGLGAQVISVNGKVVASVGAPWAKDATGKSVNTYYTTNGKTLTQHVDHLDGQVVYPVTADPWWGPSRIDHISWVGTAWGRSLHVYVTWYGYTTSFLFPHDAYSEAIQDANTGWSNSMYNQFICHADFAPPWKESWNLDSWRPDVGLWTTIIRKCNP